MNPTKLAVVFSTGVAFGFAVLMSCSDDAPGEADAQAACDCPAAEKPIVADRIVNVTNARSLAAGQRIFEGAQCPQDGILLSGGCTATTAVSLPDLMIAQNGPDQTGPNIAWLCEWQNNSTAAVEVQALVKCLVPAAQ